MQNIIYSALKQYQRAAQQIPAQKNLLLNIAFYFSG